MREKGISIVGQGARGGSGQAIINAETMEKINENEDKGEGDTDNDDEDDKNSEDNDE
jgi:hypothetical protein